MSMRVWRRESADFARQALPGAPERWPRADRRSCGSRLTGLGFDEVRFVRLAAGDRRATGCAPGSTRATTRTWVGWSGRRRSGWTPAWCSVGPGRRSSWASTISGAGKRETARRRPRITGPPSGRGTALYQDYHDSLKPGPGRGPGRRSRRSSARTRRTTATTSTRVPCWSGPGPRRRAWGLSERIRCSFPARTETGSSSPRS